MKNVIRTMGIKEIIMDDLIELNGFHEVTERVINAVTQSEWKTIISKHYPHIDLQDKKVNVDLEAETIILE